MGPPECGLSPSVEYAAKRGWVVSAEEWGFKRICTDEWTKSKKYNSVQLI